MATLDPETVMNEEAQEELEALQAIFAEKVVVDGPMLTVYCSVEGDSFKIRACFTEMLEEEAEISEPLPKAPPALRRSESGTMYSLGLKCLPPIQLNVIIPEDHESKPGFTLSCVWLNAAQLSALCSHLDELFDENGAPILFTWVEFLRTEVLEMLDVADGIELSVFDSSVCERDSRAIPGCFNLGEAIEELVMFEQDELAATFKANYHECDVCLDEKLGSDFYSLISCGHVPSCRSCTEDFVNLHVKEGSVGKLVCPIDGCETPLHPMDVELLGGKEAAERFDYLLLQKSLSSMEDLCYCPRCEAPCIQDKEDHFGSCSKCAFVFCTLCHSVFHPGLACVSSLDKLNQMERRLLTDSLGARTEAQKKKLEEAKLKLKQLRQERASEKFMRERVVFCPCGAGIERNQGCNKMTCSLCHCYICWVCGSDISKQGYDHFGDGKCPLFSESEIRRWNRQMQQGVAPAGIERRPRRFIPRGGGRGGNVVKNCPSCGQRNMKEDNNNHQRCWACRRHFCMVCGKLVLKTSTHYGGPCAQHS